jgi:DNA (cytosine-5)-methyltransferase 1
LSGQRLLRRLLLCWAVASVRNGATARKVEAPAGLRPGVARKPTVIDLFDGAGESSRGFVDEGFKVLAAVENEPGAREAYALNFPSHRLVTDDIKKVDFDALREEAGQPDVLLGSPPCEAFTTANAGRYRDPLDRLYKDPAGALTVHYIQALGKLEPSAFVMENVPGIAEGPLKRELRALFRKAGFPRVWFNELRAEEHGTPSRRTRLFVSNLKLEPPKQPPPPTAWECIEDLRDLEVDLPNHAKLTVSRREGARIAGLDEGESLYHWRSAEGRVLGHKTRLRPDELAPTVMGSSRFVHPFDNRFLSVREHARLMGFPDDHVFAGGRGQQYDQVGEAVPPPLARAIAREVRARLAEARASSQHA